MQNTITNRQTNIFIHDTSIVEADVLIGNDTKIWALCQIRKDAQIGNDCILGRGVFVDAGVRIGNRAKIQNYVSIFEGVTIEDGVFVGPHVCFTNDLIPRAVNPDMTLKSANDWEITPTLVQSGASIGANSTIICGVTIGRWAMIGAGSVVTKDIPDHSLFVGNPARQIGFVCKCGNRKQLYGDALNCIGCDE